MVRSNPRVRYGLQRPAGLRVSDGKEHSFEDPEETTAFAKLLATLDIKGFNQHLSDVVASCDGWMIGLACRTFFDALALDTGVLLIALGDKGLFSTYSWYVSYFIACCYLLFTFFVFSLYFS